MYYDAHTHLNDDKLYPQREKHLQDFFDHWWARIVNIGVNHDRNKKAIHISKQAQKHWHNHVLATIGVHPTETVFGDINHIDDIAPLIHQLEQVYHKNKKYIVAIGECGNDAHHGDYKKTKELQKELFFQQGLLARKHKLPLVIHSRDNFDDAFEILKAFVDLKIYFHCRGYGPDEIKKLHHTFPHLRIGFCGNISYPKAQLLRDSFEQIKILQKNTSSIHKIHFLLETDAPYLTPQTKRGTINVPANIKDIYQYISDTFNIASSLLQEKIKHAFEWLYMH